MRVTVNFSLKKTKSRADGKCPVYVRCTKNNQRFELSTGIFIYPELNTPNAVKTQLYCAIIAYCLVAIIGKELKIGRSTYEILQILGISLLDKTPVKELLANNDYKNVKELNCKQLSLSLF